MIPTCQAAGERSSAGGASSWFSPRVQMTVAACACAGASALVYAVDPNRHAVYPQCLLYRTTGFYCAGCGATRAFYALLHGRLWEAMHDNVLFVGGLPVILGLSGLYLLEGWRRNAWPPREVQPRKFLRSGLFIFALMLLFMLIRNLPGWPFDLLKPIAPS